MPDSVFDWLDEINVLGQDEEKRRLAERRRREQHLTDVYSKSAMTSPNEAAGALTGVVTGLRQVGTAAVAPFAPEYAREESMKTRALSAAQGRNVQESDMGPTRKFVNRVVPTVAGSLAQAGAMAPLGYGGLIAGMGATTGVDSYHKALDSGLSEAEAAAYATEMAAYESGMEALTGGIGHFVPGFGGLQEAVAKTVGRQPIKTTARRAIAGMTGDVVGELGTTVGQNYATARAIPGEEDAADWIDKNGSVLNSPMMRSLYETAAAAAGGSVVGSSGSRLIEKFTENPSRTNYKALPPELKVPDQPDTYVPPTDQRVALAEKLKHGPAVSPDSNPDNLSGSETSNPDQAAIDEENRLTALKSPGAQPDFVPPKESLTTGVNEAAIAAKDADPASASMSNSDVADWLMQNVLQGGPVIEPTNPDQGDSHALPEEGQRREDGRQGLLTPAETGPLPPRSDGRTSPSETPSDSGSSPDAAVVPVVQGPGTPTNEKATVPETSSKVLYPSGDGQQGSVAGETVQTARPQDKRLAPYIEKLKKDYPPDYFDAEDDGISYEDRIRAIAERDAAEDEANAEEKRLKDMTAEDRIRENGSDSWDRRDVAQERFAEFGIEPLHLSEGSTYFSVGGMKVRFSDHDPSQGREAEFGAAGVDVNTGDAPRDATETVKPDPDHIRSVVDKIVKKYAPGKFKGRQPQNPAASLPAGPSQGRETQQPDPTSPPLTADAGSAVSRAPVSQGRYSTYPINTSQGPRFAVQNSDKPGIGDTVHETQEAAQRHASIVKAMDEGNATSRARDAEKANEQAKTNAPLDEYLDATGHSPLQRGKVKGALTGNASRYTSGGETYQGRRDAVVRQMVEAGWKPEIREVPAIKEVSRTRHNRMDSKEQERYEKRRAEAGNKTEYAFVNDTGTSFVVTKAEHDYADWITRKSLTKTQYEALQDAGSTATTPEAPAPVSAPSPSLTATAPHGGQSVPSQGPEAEKPVSPGAKWTAAQAAYRSRRIGDEEFLAAKKEWDENQAEFDQKRGEQAPNTVNSPAIDSELTVPIDNKTDQSLSTKPTAPGRQRGLAGMEDAAAEVEAKESLALDNVANRNFLTGFGGRDFADSHQTALRRLPGKVQAKLAESGEVSEEEIQSWLVQALPRHLEHKEDQYDDWTKEVTIDAMQAVSQGPLTTVTVPSGRKKALQTWSVGQRVREGDTSGTISGIAKEVVDGSIVTFPMVQFDSEKTPTETNFSDLVVVDPEEERKAAEEQERLDAEDAAADEKYVQRVKTESEAVVDKALKVNKTLKDEADVESKRVQDKTKAAHEKKKAEQNAQALVRAKEASKEKRVWKRLTERTKAAKWEKGSYTVKEGPQGDQVSEVQGETFGPFGVREDIERDDGGVPTGTKAYPITHLATGLEVSSYKTKVNAKALAVWLSESGVNWKSADIATTGKITGDDASTAKRWIRAFDDNDMRALTDGERKAALAGAGAKETDVQADRVLDAADLGVGSKNEAPFVAKAREMARAVPEFAYNPVFTVEAKEGITSDGKDTWGREVTVTTFREGLKLVFKDGMTFAFHPEVFGLEAEELTPGQTVGINLEDLGIKRLDAAGMVAAVFKEKGFQVYKEGAANIGGETVYGLTMKWKPSPYAGKMDVLTVVPGDDGKWMIASPDLSSVTKNPMKSYTLAQQVLDGIRWTQPGQAAKGQGLEDVAPAEAASPANQPTLKSKAAAPDSGDVRYVKSAGEYVNRRYKAEEFTRDGKSEFHVTSAALEDDLVFPTKEEANAKASELDAKSKKEVTAAEWDKLLASGLSSLTEDDKPTLKKKAAKARQEFKGAVQELKQSMGDATTPSIGSFSPETLKAFTKVTVKAINAGALTFADYVSTLTAELGDMAESLRPLMTQMWPKLAAKHGLDPSTAEASKPEKVEASGPTLFEQGPPVEPPVEPPSSDDVAPAGGGRIPDPLATKHAHSDMTREALGLPPRTIHDPTGKDWKTVQERANKAPKSEIDLLISELLDEPRALGQWGYERTLLLRRETELAKSIEENLTTLAELAGRGTSEQVVGLEKDQQRLRDEDEILLSILDQEGSRAGYELGHRRAALERDYSVARMTLAYKAEHEGREPSGADKAKWAEMEKAVKDANAAKESERAGREAAEQALAIEKAHNDAHAKAEADKKRAESSPAKAKSLGKAKQKLSEFFDLVRQVSKPERQNAIAYVELAAKAAEVVAAYAEVGVVTFTDFMRRLGTEAKAHESTFREAWKTHFADNGPPDISDHIDPENPQSIGRVAKFLHQYVIERDDLGKTAADRDKAVAGVQELLVEALPDLTLEQTARILSGKDEPTRKLSEEEVRTEHRAQLQLLEDIQSWKKNERPNAIQERRADSDVQRKLRRIRAEAKKNANVPDIRDPAQQLQSSLDSAKTSTKNRISDLTEALRTKTRILASKTVLIPDAELATLRAERDALQKSYEETFGKREMSDAQRAAALEKSLDRQIAELETDIPKGVLYPPAKQPKRPITNPVIEAKMARRDALVARRDELRLLSPETIARSLTAKEKSLEARITKLRDDLADGRFEPKEKSQGQQPTNENVAALQEQLDLLLAERDYERKTSPEYEARQMAAYERTLANRVQFWQDRLNDGDFGAKPKKEPRKLTERQMALQYVLDTATDKFATEQERWRIEHRKTAEKIADFAGDAWDFGRDVRQTGELSPVLRQGLVYTTGHWFGAANAIRKALTAAFLTGDDHAGLSRINQQIMDRQNGRDGHYKGLRVATKGAHTGGRQEIMVGEWAKRLPWLGPLVRRTATAGEAFLNLAEAGMQDSMLATMGMISNKASKDESEFFGNAASVLTGRGNLPPRMAKALNKVLNSALLTMARIETVLFLPVLRGSLSGKDISLRARSVVLSEYVRSAVGVYLLNQALRMALMALPGDDEEDEVTIGDKWTDSDAGKLKAGRTRIDNMGGVQQTVVLLNRLARGYKTKNGVVEILGATFGGDDGGDLLWNYERSRLHPATGFAMDHLLGENVVGERVKAVEEYSLATADGRGNFYSDFGPMAHADMKAAVDELGYPRGLLSATMAFFGSGLSTYGKSEHETKRSVTYRASEALSTEDKTKSTIGVMQGYTTAEFIRDGLPKAKQAVKNARTPEEKRLAEQALTKAQSAVDSALARDAAIKSARAESTKSVKTFDDRVRLFREEYRGRHGSAMSEAFLEALKRLPAVNGPRKIGDNQKAEMFQDLDAEDLKKYQAEYKEHHKHSSHVPQSRPIDKRTPSYKKMRSAIEAM